LQIEIARRLADGLVPGGLLLLGAHERLPEPLPALEAESAWLYRRVVEQNTKFT
jgi:chemotaxis methyl-accepting protein methylase